MKNTVNFSDFDSKNKMSFQNRKYDGAVDKFGINKYRMMNDELNMNNKKLNNLVNKYNRFFKQYEQEDRKKMEMLENLQKQVENIDDSMFHKKERVDSSHNNLMLNFSISDYENEEY